MKVPSPFIAFAVLVPAGLALVVIALIGLGDLSLAPVLGARLAWVGLGVALFGTWGATIAGLKSVDQIRR